MTARTLLDDLAASRARLLRAISGVTEEQFKRRPDDGEWCIAEVLAHLLASERACNDAVTAVIAGRSHLTKATDEPDDAAAARAGRTAPVPQLIHGLQGARRVLETLIAARENSLQAGAISQAGSGTSALEYIVREKAIATEHEHAARIEALRELVGAKPLAGGGTS